MTRRNLELVEPLRAGVRGVTLLETLDRTMTPMGARLLRSWILSPLRDPARIEARLEAVGALVDRGSLRADLRAALDGVRDVERLAARAAAGRANPREMGALRDSFLRLPHVATAIDGHEPVPPGTIHAIGHRPAPGPRRRPGILSRRTPTDHPRRW